LIIIQHLATLKAFVTFAFIFPFIVIRELNDLIFYQIFSL